MPIFISFSKCAPEILSPSLSFLHIHTHTTRMFLEIKARSIRARSIMKDPKCIAKFDDEFPSFLESKEKKKDLSNLVELFAFNETHANIGKVFVEDEEFKSTLFARSA